jgi:hypothetical protein
MGNLIPLPPWATEEQRRARARYYAVLRFLRACCFVGFILFLAMMALLLARQ